MVSRRQAEEARALCAPMLKKAGVLVSQAEWESMEVADFGLGDYRREGAQIVTLVSTRRVGLKIICLLPGQTLPEHWHTAAGDDPGKEETLRVLYGRLLLYLPGGSGPVEGAIPPGKEGCYTCRDEHVMLPARQVTLEPGVKHWLQAGPEGAVVSSISSMSTCARDPFTDPGIRRVTVIAD